jgi:hypothetical protein
LAAPFLAVVLCGLDDDPLTVWSDNAAKTWLTMCIRLVVGFVALAISAPAFYFANPNDLAVDAAPATFAIFLCLFCAFEALTAATLAILLACLDKFFALNAAPTRFAVCARFVR